MWEALAIVIAVVVGLVLERRFRLTRRLPFQTPARRTCRKCGNIDTLNTEEQDWE